MLAAPEPTGDKTHTFQFCSGSVSKLHHTSLHLRRITVTVSAAFAGKFLSGEVLDAAPPPSNLRCNLTENLPAGQAAGNAIGSQSVFSLPVGGGILRFLPGKTIDGDFSVSDLLLNGLDDVCGFCDGQGTEDTVCVQTVIFLKTNGSSFRLRASDSIDLAAVVIEEMQLPLPLPNGHAFLSFPERHTLMI